MKKTLIAVSIAAALFTQACSTSSMTSESKTAEVEAVHILQPSDVAGYVAEFKQLSKDVSFKLDGKAYKLDFVDLDEEDGILVTKFEKGVVLLGVDLETRKPTNTFVIALGSTGDLEQTLNNPDDVLTSDEIKVSSNSKNAFYKGKLYSKNSNKAFDVDVTMNESLVSAGDSELVIEGDKAYLSGDLGTQAYVDIQSMIQNHPEVKTLVLANIQGSVNDEINMHTGRLIRNAGLTTLMPKGGEAHSGGVDLFAAGKQRIFEVGGKLGVHSWCCLEGKDAGQLGKSHAAHGAQLTYFREMLGNKLGPDFYFYTINSAPAQEIHLMSTDDMKKYSLTTQIKP